MSKKRDDLLQLALARGCSLRECSLESGYSRSTVQRRKADAEFMVGVVKARSELVQNASGRLTAAMHEAILTLRSLLTCEADTVRLGAARAILEHAVKFRESTEFEYRLGALEGKFGEDSPL
jgi:hypothetical protein